MAGNTTIDVIYRFLADTRQYEDAIRNMGDALDPSKVKPVDFSQFEKYIGGMKGFRAELDRLVKTQKISREEADKIKRTYDEIKQAAKEINGILANPPKGGLKEAFTAARSRGAGGAGTQGYAPNTQADVNRLTNDAALFQRAYANTFQHVGKKVVDMRTGLRATANDFKNFGRLSREELEKLATATNKPKKSFRELGRELGTLVRDFRGFARVGSSLTQIGTTLSIMGAALTGGIWKSAADYIKAVEDGTVAASDTSRSWNKEMQAIQKSSQRIGAVMAAQTIPLLEEGAKLLGKLADYFEKHPEMAALALKTGIVLTGIGAITAAVGKGITLATDIAFLTAAQEVAAGGAEVAAGAATMNVAADKIVGAAAAMNGGKGAVTAGAAGIGLGGAAILVGTTAAAAIATDKVFDYFQKRDVKFGDYITELKQVLAFSAGGAGMISEKIANIFRPAKFDVSNTGQEWFAKVAKALGLIKDPANEAADSLSNLSDVLANSAKREEALKAFEDYKADDLELLRKYYADRKEVDVKAQADILKANADLASGIAKELAQQATQISRATAEYKADENKAEAKYQDDRRKILQDASKDTLEIERNLQEQLRKLKMDYEEREAEFLAQRDAVNLVKNRQKYLRDVSEAQRQANDEIAKRREEVGRRLKELQQEYDAERKQRFADWQAKVKEITAQTKAEIDELRAKHAAELRQIQLDRNAKLKELELQLKEDRNRRYQAFIAQIRDLDAELLGESALRKKYHDAMLKELDSFLARYRSGMTSLLNSVPSKQVGGYVGGGLYKLHSGEFVLNPGTTSTLEQMLGRKLTQSSVMQLAGASNRTSVVWNDSRRFDSRLGANDRRMITNDTLDLLSSVVGG